MSLYSSVWQIKSSTHSYPLECFAGEVLFDVFWMSTMHFARRVSILFFRAIFFIIFLIKRCNDDVVLSTKLVESSGVLLINKKLFFEFEFELVFSIRLNLHVGLTILNEFYYSSLLRRWLVILVICIYLLQLSHDPNSLIPSIKKLVVIFIDPSLLIGTNFFLGYTYLSLALL